MHKYFTLILQQWALYCSLFHWFFVRSCVPFPPHFRFLVNSSMHLRPGFLASVLQYPRLFCSQCCSQWRKYPAGLVVHWSISLSRQHRRRKYTSAVHIFSAFENTIFGPFRWQQNRARSHLISSSATKAQAPVPQVSKNWFSIILLLTDSDI